MWERSGSVVECLTRDRGFEPHWRHCVVSFSKNINPSLELVQPRKTRPFIAERLLMGRKESKQTNIPPDILMCGSRGGGGSSQGVHVGSKVTYVCGRLHVQIHIFLQEVF